MTDLLSPISKAMSAAAVFDLDQQSVRSARFAHRSEFDFHKDVSDVHGTPKKSAWPAQGKV